MLIDISAFHFIHAINSPIFGIIFLLIMTFPSLKSWEICPNNTNAQIFPVAEINDANDEQKKKQIN